MLKKKLDTIIGFCPPTLKDKPVNTCVYVNLLFQDRAMRLSLEVIMFMSLASYQKSFHTVFGQCRNLFVLQSTMDNVFVDVNCAAQVNL